MKRYIKIILFTIVVASAFSCKKFLDASTTTAISEEAYWETSRDASNFVTDIYAKTFRVIFEGSIFFDEMMSDNSYLVWSGWFTNVQLLANGTQDAYGTVPFNIWSQHYTNIRKCNLFYENIDKVKGISAAEKQRLIAEVKFMEAYNYHRLAIFFGKVPLIKKSLTAPESNSIDQATHQEVINHVLSRLDDAIAGLVDKPVVKGRIDWGTAVALKARVFLNENRFDKVLETTNLLDGKYSLNTVGTTPYEDLFNGKAENSNEIIFSIIRKASSGSIAEGHTANQIFLLKGMSGGDAFRAATPTGSLVDSYPMADGRLIKEAGSSYNPAEPYLNRDPRFYQSIIYPTGQIKYWNGSSLGTTLYDPENVNMIIKAQLYTATEPSSTGYVWNKYVDWSPYAMVNITDCTNDIIIFRYADVLLMKAEAMAELSGAKADVIGIVNQLRSRVGGGLVHSENYNTKEDIINLVRNERRIELAGEGLRYFDLLRWKAAEKSPVTDGLGLKGDLYGARMRKDGAGSTDRTVTVDGQQRRWIEQRFFNPVKHYLQPIPQAEIDLNKKLVQNPGW